MKIQDIDAGCALPGLLEQLPKGAFLTVRHGNRINTMTIGWGAQGIIWTGPVFIVAVRNSRHTFKLIERAPDFTVSVPETDAYKKALAFCGTRSGKDVNKFDECGLTTRPGRTVASPVIELPGVHLECQILLRAPMSPELMITELFEFYPQSDFHTLYFGRILAAYRLTSETDEK